MIARDLKPGDEIGLWTVVRVFEVCGVSESRIESSAMTCSTGEPLMMKHVSRSADPWNTLIHVELERGNPEPGTWRTWFLADEEVSP